MKGFAAVLTALAIPFVASLPAAAMPSKVRQFAPSNGFILTVCPTATCDYIATTDGTHTLLQLTKHIAQKNVVATVDQISADLFHLVFAKQYLNILLSDPWIQSLQANVAVDGDRSIGHSW
ncbi:hypothetical protein IWQ60_009037 [Tieghemiomyces parasiticus]|uniref:Uncharacterized protein n=1 Tax=Tieghemiomyces parasiticus TaxID=78921 RepID=A0A9W7ZPI6_9FUNG|nr:hypothetical protein IWQ60_009037 [Tieghemiomyces parasiticus]